MKSWSTALAVVVGGLMVTTMAFAQATTPSSDKPGDTKSPSAGGADKSDTMKSNGMKSDTMKSDSTKSGGMKSDMKSDGMQKAGGGKAKGDRAARGGNREQVRAAQQALKDKGHDPGSIDGVMGPKTQKALKDFQKAEGLKGTGRLDAETMAKLGVEGRTGAAGGSSPAASPATSPSTAPSAGPAAPEPSKSEQRTGESTQQTDKNPSASPGQEMQKKEKSQ